MNETDVTRPAVRALFWALLFAGFVGAAAVLVWVALPHDAADGDADTFVVRPDQIPAAGARPIFLAPQEIWLIHLAPFVDGFGATGPGLLAFDARVPQSGTLALWYETAWLLPQVQDCLDDPSCGTFVDPAAPGYFFDVNSRFSAAGQRLFGPSPDDLARHHVRRLASGTVVIERGAADPAAVVPLPYAGPTAPATSRRLFLLAGREGSPYPLPDLLAARFLVRESTHDLDGIDPTAFAAVVVDAAVFDRPGVAALVHAAAQAGAVVAAIDVAMIDLAHVATYGTTDPTPDHFNDRWGLPLRSPHVATRIRGASCSRDNYLTRTSVARLVAVLERGEECQGLDRSPPESRVAPDAAAEEVPAPTLAVETAFASSDDPPPRVFRAATPEAAVLAAAREAYPGARDLRAEVLWRFPSDVTHDVRVRITGADAFCLIYGSGGQEVDGVLRWGASGLGRPCESIGE